MPDLKEAVKWGAFHPASPSLRRTSRKARNLRPRILCVSLSCEAFGKAGFGEAMLRVSGGLFLFIEDFADFLGEGSEGEGFGEEG